MSDSALRAFCEYLSHPVGLDTPTPRFSWIYDCTDAGCAQTRYRIRVRDAADDPAAERGLAWDTGWVDAADTVNIPYAGQPLATGRCYRYTVELTTNAGREVKSAEHSFTTGLMGPDAAWRALWIGGPSVERHAFWYRRELRLEQVPERAVAFVASPNYHILSVNGEKIGDAVLNNAWTDCAKTILYSTYDITPALRPGDNALGLATGNGWHNLRMSEDRVGGGENTFSMQILLMRRDGSREWLLSGLNEWRYTTDGPITYNGIYNGETYDARRELPGWDRPGHREADSPPGVAWADPVEREPPGGAYRAQTLEPIKVVDTLRPVAVHAVGDGSYGVDFGQNFAGWVRLTVDGQAGDTVTMKFAELEHPDHSVNQENLRLARATDAYTLKGGGRETYEPSFTYHGFRYMQVWGLRGTPSPDMFLGCVVRSAVERIGGFDCDNALLNQLYNNIQWTEAANLHGLPTDCPQRDERLGWLNDMTVRNECALYNFRLPQLYAKWLRDIRDAQGRTTGAITDTAPFLRYGLRPADPVSSSFLLIPWNLYLHYGDKQVIEENYDAMAKWIGYLKRNSDGGVVKYSQMGDWAGPLGGANPESIGAGAVSAITPTRLIGSCYFHYDCLLMAAMAGVLGRDGDAAMYREEAETIRRSVLREYFDADKKCFVANSQGSNTLPLYLGMENPGDRDAILQNLVADIRSRDGGSLTTGNLCTRYIIEVLLQNGFEDLAFSLLTRTAYPSWGYMIANGATTIWERWEHITGGPLTEMASHNHPMNGSVGVSFHKHLAGIQPDASAPGFAAIVIKPIVPRGMRRLSATVASIRGVVRSAWSVGEDGSFTLEATIPFNCRGSVRIPLRGRPAAAARLTLNGRALAAVPEGDSLRVDVGSGVHVFHLSGESPA